MSVNYERIADWVVPREEWEALGWEWIPDTCPTIIAIVEAFEVDKTATRTEVIKAVEPAQPRRCLGTGGCDGIEPPGYATLQTREGPR